MPSTEPPSVVYLFGAGATQACVDYVGSSYGILMRDLALPLAEAVSTLLRDRPYSNQRGLEDLFNNVIDEDTDFEQLITFLDDSPSAIHRAFADDVRASFEQVLRARLKKVAPELDHTPNNLYTALIDLYNISEVDERLRGCMTLNYDSFLETAVAQLGGRAVDYGISVYPERPEGTPLTILKLHGSFTWDEVWPVRLGEAEHTLWIPPGIRKSKYNYPFNLLWGRARELLDCDILRVVGCKLGPNDWDLISLLFSTRHVNELRPPYRIELIDSPEVAERIKQVFPYLGIRSIFEVEPVGSQIIGELRRDEPVPWEELTSQQQNRLLETLPSQNWFALWLNHKVEAIYRTYGTVATETGAVERLLGAG